jgi:NSS family neurotransmitter:Na+ symporter
MARRTVSIHGQWSTRLAFILAATGSAVGLGNIWRFPYVAGENGGGAFVLVYLACVTLLGLPIMMAEVMLGRRGRQSPINTMRSLAEEEGVTAAWRYIGWLGMLAGFLILSFYSVIAGWAMAYVVRTASGVFEGVTAQGATSIFGDLVSDPERLLAWHTVFMVSTMVIVARGVRSGLEQAVRYLMPALFALLLLLVGYAMAEGAFAEGLRFMFTPDWSKLSWLVVLEAMGLAFFSLSLGMGAIMVYGSYLPADASIPRTCATVAGADTLVALLAGVAIFPIVFAYGLDPGSGPGLIFETLPIAFGAMPGGVVFGTLFFVLLTFAAWTSAISVIEPAVAWLVENAGLSRVAAAVWSGLAAWLIGIGTVLSFSVWSDPLVFGKTFFDLLDYLTANIMLPLGGLLIAVFTGWVMTAGSVREEMAMQHGGWYTAWYQLLRFLAPVGVILIFAHAIGLV